MKRLNIFTSRVIRFFIFLLFIVSGISKLFPIWAFEKQLVDLGISTWCKAHYLSRLIIGLELALGISIIQSHFIKRIVIPTTIFLLTVFSIHLIIEMYQHGPLNGNCGCFGQWMPMTPLAAFIKNVVTIGLVVYLYNHVSENKEGSNNFYILLLIYFSVTLLLFIVRPFSPCIKEAPSIEKFIKNDTISVIQSDTITVKDTVEKVEGKSKLELNNAALSESKKSFSKFSKYSVFGSTKVNFNEGEKIICFFAPGCDHCRETAKEICVLSKSGNFPEVYIFFMEEETHLISDFFKVAQCDFQYQIINPVEFWGLFGMGVSTPGVFYLRNGHIIKSFEGINKGKFNSIELKKSIKSK
jgi:hypothetical protein